MVYMGKIKSSGNPTLPTAPFPVVWVGTQEKGHSNYKADRDLIQVKSYFHYYL